jgi:hypothetical protein
MSEPERSTEGGHKPVFRYAALYDEVAEADDETVFELHAGWTGAGLRGNAADGVAGHLLRGRPRGHLKDLDELETRSAGAIVLREAELENAAARDSKLIDEETDADAEALRRVVDTAAPRHQRTHV